MKDQRFEEGVDGVKKRFETPENSQKLRASPHLNATLNVDFYWAQKKGILLLIVSNRDV